MKLINYTKLSELLAGNKDSIREGRYPNKYHNQIEFIKRWEAYMLEELKHIK